MSENNNAEKDLLLMGANLFISDELIPNAEYVIKKLRNISKGKPIDQKMILELSLQAMIIMSNFGKVTGSLKKEVVLYSLRKLVIEADDKDLDIMSKSALMLLLSDDGLISSTIDNLVWVTTQKINWSGMTKCLGCKSKIKSLPKDFPQESNKLH